MTLIASICCIVRQIIRKVHAGDILMQTTGVVQVHDIGVVSLVLLGVYLGKLALADAGDVCLLVSDEASAPAVHPHRAGIILVNGGNDQIGAGGVMPLAHAVHAIAQLVEYTH